MAAKVTLWRPSTGEKRVLYTVDAKELLGGTNADGWRVYSAQAEAVELERKRLAAQAAAKTPVEELAAATMPTTPSAAPIPLNPSKQGPPAQPGLLDEMLSPAGEKSAGFPENPDPLG